MTGSEDHSFLLCWLNRVYSNTGPYIAAESYCFLHSYLWATSFTGCTPDAIARSSAIIAFFSSYVKVVYLIN